MDTTIVSWLGSVGRTAFLWSLGAFLVVNVGAVIILATRRDRALVNTWTSRLLAFDLLLLGTGVGVPMVTTMAKLTVSAISSSFGKSGVVGDGQSEALK